MCIGDTFAQAVNGEEYQKNLKAYRKQVVQHLKQEVDSFRNELDNLDDSEFDRRFGFHGATGPARGLVDHQLEKISNALSSDVISSTMGDIVENGFIMGAEALAPEPTGKFKFVVNLARATGSYIGLADPKYDVSGWGVTCQSVRCGIHTPESEFVPYHKILPKVISK